MMKTLRWLALLPALAMVSCNDREATAVLPTAPEGGLGFRIQAADSLPVVDSVRIHVTGTGVDQDTVLPWGAKQGGIKALPTGVKYTATMQGLKLVNGRKVVAWSATDTVTLNSTTQKRVVDLKPEVKTLVPLFATDFSTTLGLFSGAGDTLIYAGTGDRVELTFQKSDAADSVYLGGTAIALSGRNFSFQADLNALPTITVVARDGMSRTWMLAPKAFGEPLNLIVEADRTLGKSGEVLVDSMGYVVAPDRTPLVIRGIKTLLRNDTALDVNGDSSVFSLPVPVAGTSRMDFLVGTDHLGRKDTILIRSARAADTTAPKVGVSVSPGQSIVAGAPVEVEVTFTVAEDSLVAFMVDGATRGIDSTAYAVKKTLNETDGWSIPWEAKDRAGHVVRDTVAIVRYSADVKDTVPPELGSLVLDVKSWTSSGTVWIKGGSVNLKAYATDDRQGMAGIAGLWLRASAVDGLKDSVALTKGDGFWEARVQIDRDTILEVVARDKAGNSSQSSMARMKVDGLAPEIKPDDSMLRGPQDVTVGFVLGEGGVGLHSESLLLSVDGKSASQSVSVSGNRYQVTLPAIRQSGRHVVELKACDRLLNCAVDSVVVRIDADGPSISGLPGTGERVVADSTGGRSAVLEIRDPSGVKEVKAVSVASTVEAVRKAGSDWLLEIPSFPEGDVSWSLVATDSLGNVHSAPFTTYRVAAPTADTVGQVSAGATVKLTCGAGATIVVDGKAQGMQRFSQAISGALTVSAYCAEGTVDRSISKPFSWTVAPIERSSLVSVKDSVTDSTGALELVLAVKNASSIKSAVLGYPSSVTGVAAFQVTGSVDVRGNQVSFKLGSLPEGLTKIEVTVTDANDVPWNHTMKVRRVPAPTKGNSPSTSIGDATVFCGFENDTLYLDGNSRKSNTQAILISQSTSYTGRCVDAMGHSSRTVVLDYKLADFKDSLLTLDGKSLKPSSHLVVVLVDSLRKAPRLIIGEKATGVVYGFEMDLKNPWMPYKTSEATSKWTLEGLDTLLVAKGYGSNGAAWLVAHGSRGGLHLVESSPAAAALGEPNKAPLLLSSVLNLTRLMAVVWKDTVFLTATPGTVTTNASQHFLFTTLTGFSENLAYAALVKKSQDPVGWLRSSDLGLSSNGPVFGWIGKDMIGRVLDFNASNTEPTRNNLESFGEMASGAATKGWQLVYPQSAIQETWSLTARKYGYGVFVTTGGNPAPLISGSITGGERPALAFGRTQGWLALPGGHLWRFNLDGKEVEKGVNASKIAELASTAVSSGMVDEYGHAWFTQVGTDDAFHLLRASP